MDWNGFLSKEFWGVGVSCAKFTRFALGIVARHRTGLLILERSVRAFLPYRCEIPNDIVSSDSNNGVVEEAKKIVKQQAGVHLNSVGGILTTVDYQNVTKIETKMLIIWGDITSPEVIVNTSSAFRFGTYIEKHEVIRYDILSPCLKALKLFWKGGALSTEIKEFLIVQANRSGIWKFKVRFLVLSMLNTVLIIRRGRKGSRPKLFEFPGREYNSSWEFTLFCSEVLYNQTGLTFSKELSYLGNFDFIDNSEDLVREFFFSVSVADEEKGLKLSNHSEGFFVSHKDFADIEVTDFCAKGFELFVRRYFPEQNEKN